MFKLCFLIDTKHITFFQRTSNLICSCWTAYVQFMQVGVQTEIKNCMSYTSSWLNKTFADLAFRFHHGNIVNPMKNHFLIMQRTVLPSEVSGFCLSKMSINSDLPRQEQWCCNTPCMEQPSTWVSNKSIDYPDACHHKPSTTWVRSLLTNLLFWLYHSFPR